MVISFHLLGLPSSCKGKLITGKHLELSIKFQKNIIVICIAQRKVKYKHFDVVYHVFAWWGYRWSPIFLFCSGTFSKSLLSFRHHKIQSCKQTSVFMFCYLLSISEGTFLLTLVCCSCWMWNRGLVRVVCAMLCSACATIEHFVHFVCFNHYLKPSLDRCLTLEFMSLWDSKTLWDHTNW